MLFVFTRGLIYHLKIFVCFFPSSFLSSYSRLCAVFLFLYKLSATNDKITKYRRAVDGRWVGSVFEGLLSIGIALAEMQRRRTGDWRAKTGETFVEDVGWTVVDSYLVGKCECSSRILR